MSMGTDTGVLGRPGGALEVGDLRFLEDGGERGGALGSDVVLTETASEGRRGRGERVSMSTGSDKKADGYTMRRRESRLRRALSHGRTRDCAQRSWPEA